jgi:hypothetical protein
LVGVLRPLPARHSSVGRSQAHVREKDTPTLNNTSILQNAYSEGVAFLPNPEDELNGTRRMRHARKQKSRKDASPAGTADLFRCGQRTEQYFPGVCGLLCNAFS